ncbi:hypothetical protein GUITHDRAFT_159096 [Guillardia theta CCMP2712]|uniref:Dipeptidase n=1 Tax=Guillardia theta (strain CCMP2712) TaxID=905079 RepID=L1K2K5_GUITC|nr:hypothetical protein GUITHDRAFT_159096 [Guillardia theta CCMP2712]EKX54792.1 hypothetical protein GUITHDRAFT_159096 [Guillardia theta CCMP2712]|eukprot:XP_005841772.1 hypothetical protein GUITHDRAFT_159096 [Guillardia theta CCMP2712]
MRPPWQPLPLPRLLRPLLLGIAFFLSCITTPTLVRACTTILATPGSTVDGSTLNSHSNDGEGTVDPRLVRIAAADHEPNSLRDIFFAYEEYPRYIGYSRNVSEYFPSKDQTPFAPIGRIPQVPHTFAYFEETYGVINEKQVSIAESTCSGVFGAKPAGQGGKAIMSVDTLSQLAMERAATAREAVQIMGDLAVKYGFYGAGSFEGTAESLLVGDPNEGWVFHILPDDTGTSAIWVAQKVPDGHVTIVANMFIIREVNLADSENFLGSPNMFSIAQSKGWWTPGSKFDFTAIFSDGEYAHKFYTGRRIWRAYDILAPSSKFPTTYKDIRYSSPYPFSIAPDTKVELATVMAIMRDSLEGTPFDMTAGLAAGPFGSPDRWIGGDGESKVAGNWERPIALFRTSDSYVAQSRKWLPAQVGGLVWFGPHGAHATVYVPFAIGMQDLPPAYKIGNPSKLDRRSAYWAHRYVENLANLRWSDMIKDIRAQSSKWEETSKALVGKVDQIGLKDPKKMTDLYIANANGVIKSWWKLADDLMEKYADGNVYGKPVGYPAWWLQAAILAHPPVVGYPNGPPPVPSTAMQMFNRKHRGRKELKPQEALVS